MHDVAAVVGFPVLEDLLEEAAKQYATPKGVAEELEAYELRRRLRSCCNQAEMANQASTAATRRLHWLEERIPGQRGTQHARQTWGRDGLLNTLFDHFDIVGIAGSGRSVNADSALLVRNNFCVLRALSTMECSKSTLQRALMLLSTNGVEVPSAVLVSMALAHKTDNRHTCALRHCRTHNTARTALH